MEANKRVITWTEFFQGYSVLYWSSCSVPSVLMFVIKFVVEINNKYSKNSNVIFEEVFGLVVIGLVTGAIYVIITRSASLATVILAVAFAFHVSNMLVSMFVSV